MSKDDGLDQLAVFLKRTKEQAERSIDILNEKIGELENENQTLKNSLDELNNKVWLWSILQPFKKNSCEFYNLSYMLSK